MGDFTQSHGAAACAAPPAHNEMTNTKQTRKCGRVTSSTPIVQLDPAEQEWDRRQRRRRSRTVGVPW